MGSNQGFQNESLIAEALNGKTYDQINQNLQSLIKNLFGYPEEGAIIESAQIEGVFKPDIYIKYKGQTKNISVKVGRANKVHGENVKDFILFLRSLGISEQTQKIMLLFHYGDGTLDGSGKRRLDSLAIRIKMDKLLKIANRELNSSREVIDKVMERVLFQGIADNGPNAEYIYFGSPEYGQIVSKRQIYTYIDNRSWQFATKLHIGPIFIRPHARYADKKIFNPLSRERVHCYWPNLADDLDRISKRFSF